MVEVLPHGEECRRLRVRAGGQGGEILARILRDADSKRLPVRLECLKWNPAVALYRRHGFVVTYDSETHFHMERPALTFGHDSA